MYRFRAGFGALTDELAQAIAQFEGFNTSGSVAARNNNPGNLRSGPGQTGTDASGYAIFPTAAAGWSALDNQVDLNVSRGLTLDQFFAGGNGYPGYAPSADSNNPAQYAAFVASQTGIPETVPLNQLPSGSPDSTPAPVTDSSITTGPFVGAPDVFSTSSSDTSISADSSGAVSSSGIDPLVWAGVALGALGLIIWAT